MTSLTHIAPQLPPAIDGVGDYCWNLWRHWPEENADWKFLVARNVKATAAHWPEAIVHEFTSEKFSLAESLEQLGSDIVVLHYVGYGFQPKGIPVWLPREIERWKRADPRRRLVTMFHEMYARSSPLRSPFWVAPVACHIIRQLARLSDAWVTSCKRYFDQLTTHFGARVERGRIISIGSNIPRVASASERTPNDASIPRQFRVVIFGLARTRIWALERHVHLLRALHAAGRLESITLLGAREGIAETRERERLSRSVGDGVKWSFAFDLSPSEISAHLLQHDFGLLANEPDILTKSGVFAALAEHSVLPIVSTRDGQTLSPELVSAVLTNSDRPADVPKTLGFLDDDEQFRAMRGNLCAFSARALAWPRITELWSEVLQPFASRNFRSAPELQLATNP